MTARGQKNKPQPQLNQQLQASQQPSTLKEKDEVAIEFGKFLLDLAKLTFGGMFLTAIMDLSVDMKSVILICATVIVALSILGFVYIYRGNNKNKKK